MVILNLPLSNMIMNTWCHPLMDTWNLSLDASPWELHNPHKHRQYTKCNLRLLSISQDPMWYIICAYVMTNFGLTLSSSSWSTFIFDPWLILMSWMPYWFLVTLHCFKKWLPISQFTMTISSFSMNLILAITCSSSWYNIWAHHDPIFKTYVEFLSLIILSRSSYIMVQTKSQSMKMSEIFNEFHIDHILFITWNSSWSYHIWFNHWAHPWCMHNNMYMTFI